MDKMSTSKKKHIILKNIQRVSAKLQQKDILCKQYGMKEQEQKEED